VVPDNYSASSIWKHLASISAIKHVVKWRKSPFERPLNKKKIRNDVTTGNASEVAAITLFLFLCCDNNLGKRDYNPDKGHFASRFKAFHGWRRHTVMYARYLSKKYLIE